jgi:hypothetical protein
VLTHVPDWITAVATAATAMAAGCAAFIAWRAYRRDARMSEPIVEAEIDWGEAAFADYLCLTVLIRNQLYQTITIDSVTAIRPKGMCAAVETRKDFYGDLIKLEPGSSPKRVVGHEIQPLGTSTDFYSPGTIRRYDIFKGTYYFSPPGSWKGGVVKLVLRISSKAVAAPDSRIVIHKRISAV